MMDTTIPDKYPAPETMIPDLDPNDGAVCIGCGCTDLAACETDNGPCHWLVRNEEFILGVCSACDHALGVWQILQERARQIVEEDMTAKHDDTQIDESLALAAACYAAPCGIYRVKHGNPEADPIEAEIVPAWPEGWHPAWDKRGVHPRIRQLAIAGALIAAEMDRLRRAGLGNEP